MKQSHFENSPKLYNELKKEKKKKHKRRRERNLLKHICPIFDEKKHLTNIATYTLLAFISR